MTLSGDSSLKIWIGAYTDLSFPMQTFSYPLDGLGFREITRRTHPGGLRKGARWVLLCYRDFRMDTTRLRREVAPKRAINSETLFLTVDSE